jgi:hypothetical protein
MSRIRSYLKTLIRNSSDSLLVRPWLAISLVIFCTFSIITLNYFIGDCLNSIEESRHNELVNSIQAVDKHIRILNTANTAQTVITTQQNSADTISKLQNLSDRIWSDINVYNHCLNETNNARQISQISNKDKQSYSKYMLSFMILLTIFNAYMFFAQFYQKKPPLPEVDWDDEAIQNYGDTT